MQKGLASETTSPNPVRFMAPKPQIPHGRQSFHLRSWQDLVAKLTFEIEEFERTRLIDREAEFRTFRAVNGAVTAWHIGDWLWDWMARREPRYFLPAAEHVGMSVSAEHDTKRIAAVLASGMAAKHRDLAICRTITNAYKHVRSTRFPDVLMTHPVHVLQIVPGTNRASGESWHDLRVFSDGQVLDVADVLKGAEAAWTVLFRDCGLWSIRGGWAVDARA